MSHTNVTFLWGVVLSLHTYLPTLRTPHRVAPAACVLGFKALNTCLCGGNTLTCAVDETCRSEDHTHQCIKGLVRVRARDRVTKLEYVRTRRGSLQYEGPWGGLGRLAAGSRQQAAGSRQAPEAPNFGGYCNRSLRPSELQG